MISMSTTFKGNALEIATEMWNQRHDLEIGITTTFSSNFSLELHRISETEFVFVMENVPREDKYQILDMIFGRGS